MYKYVFKLLKLVLKLLNFKESNKKIYKDQNKIIVSAEQLCPENFAFLDTIFFNLSNHIYTNPFIHPSIYT